MSACTVNFNDRKSVINARKEINRIIDGNLENINETILSYQIAIKKALHEIGDHFTNRNLDKISQLVYEILEEQYGDEINSVIPSYGIKNALSKEFRKKYVNNTECYEGEEMTSDDIWELDNKFLNTAFGQKSQIKKDFRVNAALGLVRSFIIDRQTGVKVNSIADINSKAQQYKQELFNIVRKYYGISDDYSELNEENLKNVQQQAMFLEAYENPQKAQELYNSVKNVDGTTNVQAKAKYEAFRAWFTLRNFDNFVNLLIGDYIKIAPNSNILSTNQYTFTADKGHHVVTTWSNDDNINIEQNISKLAQLLVNTTPYYKMNSNVFTEGKFITFEQFYDIISKIKNLALDPSASTLEVAPNMKGFENVTRTSFRTLINNIRLNPQKNFRLVIKALVDGKFYSEFDFTEEQKNVLYSMYKGIFGDGKSIYGIEQNYGYEGENFYELLTQVADTLFSVDFMQYNEDNGKVSVRVLKELSVDNAARAIESTINGLNTRRIMKLEFPQQVKQYNVEYDSENKKLTYKIGDKLTVSVTTSGNLSYIGSKGNLSDAEKVNLIMDPEIRQFLDSQLGLNLMYDRDLQEGLDIQMNGEYGKSRQFNTLFKLASTVMLNKYISNVLLDDVTRKSEVESKLSEIYPNSGEDKNKYKPYFNRNLMEMGLIPDNMMPDLREIATAKAISTGEFTSTLVKDADGNTLSSQTLSRLLGSLTSQWEYIMKDANNAASHFSLFMPGLYKGHFTAKELKSPSGNKPLTQFTVAEFAQSNFLYDFVGGLLNIEGKTTIGNGVVALLPSVNSDKTTIGRILLDLNKKVKINGVEKPFKDLTEDELYEVARTELYTAYKKNFDKVRNDFSKLGQFIGVNIDPANSFREFNEYCKQNGFIPKDHLFEKTREYNNAHPNDHIQLIQNTHYQENKDGTITYNNTNRTLLHRFSNPERMRRFMELKKVEMLKSLVDENFNISLLEKESGTTPKSYLRSMKDWVSRSGDMILAKATLQDGTVVEIRNKTDLSGLRRSLGFALDYNVHDLLDKVQLELHPMLAKYNALDFMFTQEFMIAGVGSHTNHPGKQNYSLQTAYIYANDNRVNDLLEQNRDRIFNFDSYYADMLDAYLNSKIKVEQSSSRYDAERFNIEQSGEYQQLLDALYKEAKGLAQQQNKILVTSNEYLRNKYTRDFMGSDFSQINNAKQVFYQLIRRVEEGEMAEEASRFLAQHKRNVSYTAAMHEFQLEQIKGIPTEYNMAIMEDIYAPVYNHQGDSQRAKPFDGATFVNPFIVYLENFSLKGDKAGIDKKQFIHFYDALTGTGGIIKTAGFGLTNDRIRSDKFYQYMMYNMTNKVWRDHNGNQITNMRGQGILEDFNGDKVNYGDVYYADYSQENPYRMRQIIGYKGNNTYEVAEYIVDEYGSIISEVKTEDNQNFIRKANSNYDLWEMFGGMDSMELRDGKLVPSEKSIQLTTKAIYSYGTKKEGVTKATTAEDLYQPLKHSDIHYMPTIGAVKHGAANVNPAKAFYGKFDLSTMKVRMVQAGIQLDKEHHADNAELSLMTQVISAACAKGYTKEMATKLYNALYNITKSATSGFRDEVGKIAIGDRARFGKLITSAIMKSIVESDSNDGDALYNSAVKLVQEIRKDKKLLLDEKFLQEADGTLPYSSSTIYGKIVNILAVTMTKAGIKTKMPGLLAVLCPTHDVIKMYNMYEGGKVRSYRYDEVRRMMAEYGVSTPEQVLEVFQQSATIFNSISDIEMGYKYLVTLQDGTQRIYQVVAPHRIKFKTPFGEQLEKQIGTSYNGIPVYQIGYQTLKDMNPQSFQEWVMDGQDLKSYNVKFSDGVNNYQLADLDIVQDYFTMRDSGLSKLYEYLSKYNIREKFIQAISSDLGAAFNDNPNSFKWQLLQQLIKSVELGISLDANTLYNSVVKEDWTSIQKENAAETASQFVEYLNNYQMAFFNNILQNTLDGITDGKEVLVNGNLVTIQNHRTQSYGIVMPKVFKGSFGLEEGTKLNEVTPEYFARKLAEKLVTRVSNYFDDETGTVINLYDLELKRANGNHLYIRDGLEGCNLTHKIEWYSKVENGTLYRIDSDGNILNPMKEGDEIYLDDDGNEIIVTSGSEGLKFHIDNQSFSTFNICVDRAKNNEQKIREIVLLAQESTNKKAQKLGKYLATKTKFKDLRKTILKLNDYSQLLNEDVPNEDKEVKDWSKQHLLDLANEQYTSFKRQLDLVAARIPAQSQQSFMSMEIQGFSDPDINNAYVSIFQFYLQGSDLDIDAVSLQTFAINEDGIYEGYSPYYNIQTEDLRKVSDTLPFPTGEKVKVEKVDTIKNTTIVENINDIYLTTKQENQGLIGITLIGDNAHVEFNLNTPENIYKVGQLISKLSNGINIIENTNGLAAGLSDYLSKKYNIGGFTISENQAKQIQEQLINLVDNHNTYLSKVHSKKRERILKNYIVTQLFEISRSPKNLLQSQSSVDTITEPAKKLSKTSVKATVQNTFTPGNVINKFQSISENMVGKDDIAICATGLKTFFALTQMYNEILDSDNEEAKKSLLFDVKVGGKVYHGLANGYSKIPQTDAGIRQYLYEQALALDAALGGSALLGLSADNAKELVLAKINAGTATMGMYLYGMSIGVPFETIFKIMSSPIGFRIAELVKGDSFNGDSGKFTILNAIKYLRNAPQNISIRSSLDLSGMKDIEYPSTAFLNALNKKLGKEANGLQTLTKMWESDNNFDMVSYLEELRNKTFGIENSDLKLQYEAEYNKCIDLAIQYVNDYMLANGNNYYSTIYGGGNILTDMETLAEGAEEMKEIGKILRLNQEIKTNSSDLIAQMDNIRECLQRRQKVIDRYSKTKTKMPPIDLEQFLTDEKYAQQMIDSYDSIKKSYNPLRIIHDVPHYRGYVESFLLAYKGVQEKSVKFRAIEEISKSFIDLNKVSNKKTKDQVVKNVEKAIDYVFRAKQMEDIDIKIPAGDANRRVYAFVDSTENIKEVTQPFYVNLGTDMGQANFKLYMERVVIPDLKQKYPNNKFIRDLLPTVQTRTNYGTPAVNYGLRINMLPKSDYELDVFNEYKDEFNNMSKFDMYNGYMVQDLFYYYSMISNYGKLGPNSLHKIFEDYEQVSEVAKHFRQVISNLDKNQNKTLDLLYKTISDDFIAPISSPYAKVSSIIRYINPELGVVERMKLSSDEGSEYDDNYYAEEVLSPEDFERGNINGYISYSMSPRNQNFFTNPVANNDGWLIELSKTLTDVGIKLKTNTKDGKVTSQSLVIPSDIGQRLMEKGLQLNQIKDGYVYKLPTKFVSFKQVYDTKDIEDKIKSIDC